MNREQITVGQLLTWLYEPRGGYGYVIPVDALVLKLGAKRVQVQVKKQDGTSTERWVSPDRLREQNGGAS